jgi:hypothetical protein
VKASWRPSCLVVGVYWVYEDSKIIIYHRHINIIYNGESPNIFLIR